MRNNCIYLKIKLNGKIECKKQHKLINIKECCNCKFKELKLPKTKIKKRTYKQSKLEKNRKSVFTDNLDYCIVCGSKKEHLHEIYSGKNRTNSIKYNFVIPVCFSCHNKMHNNIDWQVYWHKKGQLYWEKSIGTREEFIDKFYCNYL